MKENWFAISIFSVIFGILGYLLGMCGTCCNTQSLCSTDQQCTSQQSCCPSSAACSAGGENVFIHERGGHDEVHAIIHELEMEDFTGDTIITIEGGTIQMTKSDDGDVDVKVEMEERGKWHGSHGRTKEHCEKKVVIGKDGGEE